MTALRWLTATTDITPSMAEELLACWRDVTNAGGAVGFPHVPVDDATVRPAVDAVMAALSAEEQLLWAAGEDGTLAGWLVLARSQKPTARHWATVLRVQTSVAARGTGVGSAIIEEAARLARELGLAALHLTVRAGQGIEPFYQRHGYREVGRWPDALYIGDDLRDEVLMFLDLRDTATTE